MLKINQIIQQKPDPQWENIYGLIEKYRNNPELLKKIREAIDPFVKSAPNNPEAKAKIDKALQLIQNYISNPQAATQQQKTQFDANSAVEYNGRTEAYFKNYEDDIKRVLGTSTQWSSPDFATAVYDWQQKNGLSGKLVDGKFGPITISKMTQIDPALHDKYDPYAIHKQLSANDKPSKRVVDLLPEVEHIKNEMGANEIPTNILMGWCQVESAGKLSSRGLASLDERGLFQVSRDEASAIGVDHDRVANDQEYSIRAGIKLAQYHEKNVDQVLSKYPNMAKYFPKNDDIYWALMFFSFSAGQATMEKLITDMSNSGYEPNNWSDVMKFASLNAHNGYKHSPIKWAWHANRAMNIGNQIVSNKMATRLQHRIKQAKRKAQLLVLFCDK